MLGAMAAVVVVATIAALVARSAAVFADVVVLAFVMSLALAASYVRHRSGRRWISARMAQLVTVPSADAGLDEIMTFAVATYLGEHRFGGADGLERLASHARSTWDRSGCVVDSTLVIRGLLFREAKRYQRSRAPLDESTEVYVRAMVARLNDLSVVSAGRVADDHNPVDLIGKRRLRVASRQAAGSDGPPERS